MNKELNEYEQQQLHLVTLIGREKRKVKEAQDIVRDSTRKIIKWSKELADLHTGKLLE